MGTPQKKSHWKRKVKVGENVRKKEEPPTGKMSKLSV